MKKTIRITGHPTTGIKAELLKGGKTCGVWGHGKNSREAIGNMILAHLDIFGVEFQYDVRTNDKGELI